MDEGREWEVWMKGGNAGIGEGERRGGEKPYEE